MGVGMEVAMGLGIGAKLNLNNLARKYRKGLTKLAIGFRTESIRFK